MPITYDYKKGKERIEEILDNDLIVIEQNELPDDESFTFRMVTIVGLQEFLWT